jgi:hypothetical protein
MFVEIISRTLVIKPNNYTVLVIHIINPDPTKEGRKRIKTYPGGK